MNCKIAVLIPCYNEGKTIADVVNDFRVHLPDADIYVYDNNSTDNTVEQARKSGAIVRYEKRQGKGNVVRSMFREIEADVYLLVDGDRTYPVDKAKDLIRPIVSANADMVIGSRLHTVSDSKFKPLNWMGNKLFLFLLNSIFRVKITDLLSGYRAFSRNVVKNLPILSRGFEIETELTVKCLNRGYRILEVPVNLSSRPEGSMSKIRLFSDGILIVNTIVALFRDYKPLTAFGLFGFVFILFGLVPGFVVIAEFISTGYILRIPSAILAVGLILSGLIIIFIGVVVHTIVRHFQELNCQLQVLNENIQRKTEDKKTGE